MTINDVDVVERATRLDIVLEKTYRKVREIDETHQFSGLQPDQDYSISPESTTGKTARTLPTTPTPLSTCTLLTHSLLVILGTIYYMKLIIYRRALSRPFM